MLSIYRRVCTRMKVGKVTNILTTLWSVDYGEEIERRTLTDAARTHCVLIKTQLTSRTRSICVYLQHYINPNNNSSLQYWARSTPATMSKQRCRCNWQLCCQLHQQHCRFWQQRISNVRLCRKDEISTQPRSTLLPFFLQKVESCFDIVSKKGNNI